MMRDSFGARLRAQRERKRIDLSVIAERTKIRASVFASLERDDPSGWPSGIYRRAFVRAYAEAIGLDPEAIVREFVERFPDPKDDTQPAAQTSLAAAEPADEFSSGPLRLMLADSDPGFLTRRFQLLAGGRERMLVAVCDVAVVAAVALAVWLAAGVFWRPFTIATLCYYFAGAVMCGSSPAAWLVARRQLRKPAAPVAPAIVRLAAKRSHGTRGQVTPFAISEREPVRELDEAV
jgi:transcriptional regulator with XRE-family HTH domain